MDRKQQAAPRFSLHLPMRYRPAGDPRWRTAETRNVSSSGLLFQADEPLQPGKKLEIELLMMAASPLKPCCVVATSEVVRQSSEVENLLTAVRHLKWQTHSATDHVRSRQQQ